MMNGKMTRSFSGSTGRTSGILIASSFADSFASVIFPSSAPPVKRALLQWLFRDPVRSGQCAVHRQFASACALRTAHRALLQCMQLLHEGLHVLEVPIHRGESYV